MLVGCRFTVTVDAGGFRVLQWVHQQLFLRHVFGEACPKKGLIRRVLQKSPNQVGHSRQ